MNLLSLFSGIGGIDLAAQWAGIQTVAFVEIDDFCGAVLAKHWPGVPIFEDVRDVTATTLRDAGISDIDIIAGGFPCQDVSLAGARAGLGGERSTLWFEFARLIREIRPRWVVGENVPGLLSANGGDFMARILRDLAEMGYDAGWGVWGACDVGAPHRRERVFIVAHRNSNDRSTDGRQSNTGTDWRRLAGWCGEKLGDAECLGLQGIYRGRTRTEPAVGGESVADACSERRDRRENTAGGNEFDRQATGRYESASRTKCGGEELPNANQQHGDDGGYGTGAFCGEWRTSPHLPGSESLADSMLGRWQDSYVPPIADNAGITAGSYYTGELADATRERKRESHYETDPVAVSGKTRDVSSGGSHEEHARQPESAMGSVPDGLSARLVRSRFPAGPGEAQYEWEPPRVAHGSKHRARQLKAYGNAVVPQQSYPLFAAITAREADMRGEHE